MGIGRQLSAGHLASFLYETVHLRILHTAPNANQRRLGHGCCPMQGACSRCRDRTKQAYSAASSARQTTPCTLTGPARIMTSRSSYRSRSAHFVVCAIPCSFSALVCMLVLCCAFGCVLGIVVSTIIGDHPKGRNNIFDWQFSSSVHAGEVHVSCSDEDWYCEQICVTFQYFMLEHGGARCAVQGRNAGSAARRQRTLQP